VTKAGIKKLDHPDLVVVEFNNEASFAAVFTRNAFCAAPVQIAKQHLSQSQPRYLVINTGNANAGTGDQGLQDALTICSSLAKQANVETNQVLPFSTGVIGELLPVEKITNALPDALTKLVGTGWHDAAKGILTTDTRPKGASAHFQWQGNQVHVNGIAKGAGMIRPDMATMLAFIATDADVSKEVLQSILVEAVDSSFNRITVDGDTSTNDACVLIATGKANVKINANAVSELQELFRKAVISVCEELAQAIIRDGEGASKFVTVRVAGGTSRSECLDVAYAIAHSPLVKTALFASDPNWGRILAVVGRAGITDLDVGKVTIFLDDICIAEKGGVCPTYTEAKGQAVMNQDEITIRIDLQRGDANDRIWTTDLSHDYVSINADYRS